MSERCEKEFHCQPSISEESLIRNTDSFKSAGPTGLDKSGRNSIGTGSQFEVFRNNTTAVEVIVKELPYKRKTQEAKTSYEFRDTKMKRLEEEIETLKIDLNKANYKLVTTRKGFGNLVLELKKQLDLMNQREMDAQSKILSLQLENEKLKTLLESKSKLLVKLKKEICSMKRMLKFVIKGISCVPQLPESFNFSSDPEYDDFEKGLKRGCQVRFVPNMFDGASPTGLTFDSTLPKDFNSFEKY